MMRRWRPAGRRVELVVGDLDDFEAPAVRVHALVRDEESAERVLVLAAAAEGLDPVGWVWL